MTFALFKVYFINLSCDRYMLPFVISGVKFKTGCSGKKRAQKSRGARPWSSSTCSGWHAGPQARGPVLCDVPSAGEWWGVLYKAIQPPSQHISQHVLYGKYCLHLSLPTLSCSSAIPFCHWMLALINYPCTAWLPVKYCATNWFFSLFNFIKIFV